MSTIQEQLAAFAANPVVGGVRWQVFKSGENITSLRLTIEPLLRITIDYDMLRERWFYLLSRPSMAGISEPLHNTDNATTPADACREALRLCRERVSELAGALGVGEDEGAREAIENALYATRRFLTTEASELAIGILQYLKDAGYSFYNIQPTGEKEGQA